MYKHRPAINNAVLKTCVEVFGVYTRNDRIPVPVACLRFVHDIASNHYSAGFNPLTRYLRSYQFEGHFITYLCLLYQLVAVPAGGLVSDFIRVIVI